MNKKSKNIFAATLVIAGLMIPNIVANARNIESLYSYKLPAYQGINVTQDMVKETTNGNWVIKIDSLSNAKAIQTYMANSNGVQRGQYATVGLGRYSLTSTGTANYYYHAVLMNNVSQFSTGYLTGSWSPDDK